MITGSFFRWRSLLHLYFLFCRSYYVHGFIRNVWHFAKLRLRGKGLFWLFLWLHLIGFLCNYQHCLNGLLDTICMRFNCIALQEQKRKKNGKCARESLLRINNIVLRMKPNSWISFRRLGGTCWLSNYLCDFFVLQYCCCCCCFFFHW